MSKLTERKKTITFSHFTDSVSNFTARKVNGNWRIIDAWNAGELPKLSRHPVNNPHMIKELDRNQREMVITIKSQPAKVAVAVAALRDVQPYVETGESEGDEGVRLAPIVRAAIANLSPLARCPKVGI